MAEERILNPVLTIKKYKEWVKSKFGVDTPVHMSYLDDGYIVQDFGNVRITYLPVTAADGTDLVIIDCAVESNGIISYRGIEPSDIGLGE